MIWLQKGLSLLYREAEPVDKVIGTSNGWIQAILVLITALFTVNQINPLSPAIWYFIDYGFDYLRFRKVLEIMPIWTWIYILSSFVILFSEILAKKTGGSKEALKMLQLGSRLCFKGSRTAVYVALYFLVWHYVSISWLPKVVVFAITHWVISLLLPKSYTRPVLFIEHLTLILIFNAVVGLTDLKQMMTTSASFVLGPQLYNPIVYLGPLYWLLQRHTKRFN